MSSHDLMVGVGFELVALATLALPEPSIGCADDAPKAVGALADLTLGAPVRADLAAGLMNLPPPRRA